MLILTQMSELDHSMAWQEEASQPISATPAMLVSSEELDHSMAWEEASQPISATPAMLVSLVLCFSAAVRLQLCSRQVVVHVVGAAALASSRLSAFVQW